MHKAIVVTPSRFTASARELANALDVELIGANQQLSLVQQERDELKKEIEKLRNQKRR